MMERDAYLTEVYRAGEVVPPGTYLRIDDGSRRVIVLEQHAPLPPGFDGHIALYRHAAPRLAPARDMVVPDRTPVNTRVRQ